MDPVTTIIALITAGKEAIDLAKRLAEAKKKADAEGRELTAAELAPFRQAAHASVQELDQVIADLDG